MALVASAQEIPGQKQTESALDTLADQGVLGSLCVLLIVALFFAVKALLKAKDDRFNDQRLMTEALERHNSAAKELAVEMNKAASNLVIESTKSLELVKVTLASQERALTEHTRSIASLQQESMQFRMSAQNFKCTGGKG